MDRWLDSPRLAAAASAAGVAAVALVAAVPGAPYQPRLPAGTGPSGPLRAVATLLGLKAVHGSALAALGVAAVVLAGAGFAAALRAAWRGQLALRTVVGLAVAFHGVVLLLPLLFSRDVYSYAMYGRIAGLYGQNPYVASPADFPGDPLLALVGPKWLDTPAVYGPLFTALSAGLARALDGIAALVVAYRGLAAAASLGTLALVAGLARRLRPGRAAFAAAAWGLNPVVLFQSVGSGHNDLLVALAVAGGLALLVVRRELLATAVLTLGALVKASAGVPLVLLVTAAVASRPRAERPGALARHLGVAGGLALAVSLPFLQADDPTLGLLELATHEGWLAPSRLFRRALGGLAGWAAGAGGVAVVGGAVRVLFGAGLLLSLLLLGREVARRASRRGGVAADGAAWGWGLLLVVLLGPVLLPWYVTWALPLAWLLPRVPRRALVGTSLALTVSQFTAEPSRFPAAYDLNVLFGHYVLTPLVVVLLATLLVDLRRRVRDGRPLADEAPVAVEATAAPG